MRCGSCGKEVPPESMSCPWCGNGGGGPGSLRRGKAGDFNYPDAYSGNDDMGERKPARFMPFIPRGGMGGSKRKTLLLALIVSLAVIAGVYVVADQSLLAASRPSPTAANASTQVTPSSPAYTPAPTPALPLHYYNVENQVSIDYPAGWVKRKGSNLLLYVSNPGETQMIMLQAAPTSSASLAEMSERQITQLKNALRNVSDLAENAGVDESVILSDEITCTDMYIREDRFIRLSFEFLDERKRYSDYLVIGIYDSKLIMIQFVAPSDDSEAMDDLFAYADTFRFGDNAEP